MLLAEDCLEVWLLGPLRSGLGGPLCGTSGNGDVSPDHPFCYQDLYQPLLLTLVKIAQLQSKRFSAFDQRVSEAIRDRFDLFHEIGFEFFVLLQLVQKVVILWEQRLEHILCVRSTSCSFRLHHHRSLERSRCL